ncbi:MAG: sodium:proton exchanger [Pseudomonadota bacterium]
MPGGLRTGEGIAIAAVAAAAAVTAVLELSGATDVVVFAASAIALAGLAWVVSFATEAIGERLGPAATGVLQSTLGNLPELFIVLFALSAGEIVVAKFSILGSLFANALLVLGLVIVAGASRSSDRVMRFHARLPNDTATLLLLATFVIVILGASNSVGDRASEHQVAISVIGALVLLSIYAAFLLSYLRGGGEPPSAARPRVATWVAVSLLAVSGIGAALASEWFVGSLDGAIERLGISRAFAGLVIAAIAGNAVENVAGIVLAAKRQNDLAISVVKNSVAQIAVFLLPVLVLLSLLFEERLTFVVGPVYIAALALTAIAMWQVTGDGQAAIFEGWALVGFYVVLATLTWFE